MPQMSSYRSPQQIRQDPFIELRGPLGLLLSSRSSLVLFTHPLVESSPQSQIRQLCSAPIENYTNHMFHRGRPSIGHGSTTHVNTIIDEFSMSNNTSLELRLSQIQRRTLNPLRVWGFAQQRGRDLIPTENLGAPEQRIQIG
jgi:hypothetical protein